MPEAFKEYVNDYKINLFEVAYLEPEQVKLFQSDFRIVADYFVQMRKSGDYVPDPIQMKHVQEVLQLLHVMTRDDRYEVAYNDTMMKGELTNMCEVLDKIENRGIAIGESRGIAIGEARGEEKKARETAQKLYPLGLSVENIASCVGYSIETVKKWLGLLPSQEMSS